MRSVPVLALSLAAVVVVAACSSGQLRVRRTLGISPTVHGSCPHGR